MDRGTAARPAAAVPKRILDLAVAGAGLVLFSPVLLVCLAVVRATSPGPGLFRQERVGRHGKGFVCLKMRTMYADTAHAPSHEIGSSAVTPLGRRLRRWKLDELPQLWNVLKGEMSMVGPRPCLPSQTELVAARSKLGLYAIRPGITGVSQVRGVDMSDPQRLAALDATYLENMSLTTDIKLLISTLLGSGRGDRVRPGA